MPAPTGSSDEFAEAEEAPREPTLLERYAEATEATDSARRERDRLKAALEDAQTAYENALGDEEILAGDMSRLVDERARNFL